MGSSSRGGGVSGDWADLEDEVVGEIEAWVRSGGVLVSYFEWAQNTQRLRWSKDRVQEEMRNTLCETWQNVLDYSREYKVSLRKAAYRIAVQRVKEAIDLRGF